LSFALAGSSCRANPRVLADHLLPFRRGVNEQRVIQTGEQSSYLYRKDGTLLTAINGSGIDRFTMTPNGQVQERLHNGKPYLSYNYTPYGQVESVTDSTGSRSLYHYDNPGRLDSVKNKDELVVQYEFECKGVS
jgi:YD repeat-containing protein